MTLAATFLIACGVRWILKKLLSHPSIRENGWAAAASKPIPILAFWALFLKGATLSFRQFEAIAQNESLTSAVDRGLAIAWTALFAYTTIRFATNLFDIAENKTTSDTEPAQLDRMGVARKLVIGATLSIALLLTLQAAGLDISPLLAGGAIGGVILGLALQESLSNVFAGFMMNLDSSIRVGELVRMSSGQEGFVVRVGWRTTTIRLWEEALLVVPNSKMSQEVILNLSRPAQPYIINLQCGVAYGSNLESIEHLILDKGKQVQVEFSEGAELPPPYFRWRDFGDSAVEFKIFVPISDARAQYRAKSALLKAVHEALLESGFEIPFPMRTVIVRQERHETSLPSEPVGEKIKPDPSQH